MISPPDYLKDVEDVLVKKQLDGSDEWLVCTDARLVHFSGREVTDFDLDSVNVVKYKKQPFPAANMIAALTAGPLGFLLAADPSLVGPLARVSVLIPLLAGLLLMALSAYALYEGWKKYGNELIVATPAGSYVYDATENMEEIAHAVRGAQQ